MVLKRCIYGVDKNPLTVELAKVSLWLHSFTVGAPLSFLDHHLRCGDSLIGMRVWDARDEIRRLGGLSAASAVAGAEAATAGMQRIEEMSDADVAEVRESAALFRGVEHTTATLRGLLDFLCGLRWLTAGMKKRERTEFESPLVDFLEQNSQDAYRLLSLGPGAVDDVSPGSEETSEANFEAMWSDARAVADREGFLHWEVAFPGVWHGWQDVRPRGGFDAVIGNPPWDRIELQEVEWFATRDNEASDWRQHRSNAKGSVTANGRRRRTCLGIRESAAKEPRQSAQWLGSLWRLPASQRRSTSTSTRSSSSARWPRQAGRLRGAAHAVRHLRRQDGGEVLPVRLDERAGRGPVRLRERLGKIFFKDVHASFKFCVLVFGGEERTVRRDRVRLLPPRHRMTSRTRALLPAGPDDFARVNPNTGTAPVFRTRRDAEITRRIYERHPVLVDRSDGVSVACGPSGTLRMLFNMTSDSHSIPNCGTVGVGGLLSRPRAIAGSGEMNCTYRLYQGRMIWHFDHRANSVLFNPESTHNPYLSEEVTR